MRNAIGLALAALLFGCASTPGTQYRQVYDRKYNEMRLVRSDDTGALVGTSAVRPPRARPPGQHP